MQNKIEIDGWKLDLNTDDDGHLTIGINHSDESLVSRCNVDIATNDSEWVDRFTTETIEAENPENQGNGFTATKKKLQEDCHYSKYGGGRSTAAHGIFFDYDHEVGGGGGFKYGIVVFGCTKREAFKFAHDYFLGECNYPCLGYRWAGFIAEDMAGRRKVPLSCRFDMFSGPTNYQIQKMEKESTLTP